MTAVTEPVHTCVYEGTIRRKTEEGGRDSLHESKDSQGKRGDWRTIQTKEIQDPKRYNLYIDSKTESIKDLR